jgi:haloalkane dehalogenase
MDKDITSNYTQIEGVKIHYLKAGVGKTILLIHGWPTSSYLWRDLIPDLSTKYQVIAIDLPGFGNSDKSPQDSYSFRYYKRIIDGLLVELGVEKVILGVHDLGGPIGLYWAVQDLTKVKALILFNTLVYADFSWAVKLFAFMTIAPGFSHWLSSPGGIKWAIRFGVYQKDKLNDEIIQAYQAPFAAKESRKALLKSIQRLSMKGYREIEDKLPSYQGPVQVLFGEKDKILPKVKQTMERVKNDLPQTKITSLSNCGHFLQEEEPGLLSSSILSFLEANL